MADDGGTGVHGDSVGGDEGGATEGGESGWLYLPQKGHKSHLPPRHYLHHLNEDRKKGFISLCCIIIIIMIGLINAIVVPLEAFI